MDSRRAWSGRTLIEHTVLSLLFLAGSAFDLVAAANPNSGSSVGLLPNSFPTENALRADDLHDPTVRQSFHLSAGGSKLRVHMFNAFGTGALHLTVVHIARPRNPASAAIDVLTDKALTFSGWREVTTLPGARFKFYRIRDSGLFRISQLRII